MAEEVRLKSEWRLRVSEESDNRNQYYTVSMIWSVNLKTVNKSLHNL
jgi:hypothetical protein